MSLLRLFYLTLSSEGGVKSSKMTNHFLSSYIYISATVKQTLENTKGAIKNRQSRETGNILGTQNTTQVI